MNASAVEALFNAAIGFAVSWTLTAFVLGYTPAQAVGVTLLFFCASFLRSWAIREAFRKWLS